MMSATIGWEDLMNDSLQHVHSLKWSQTTGGLAFFSKASTTWPNPEPSRPAAATATPQKYKNSRLLYPLAFMARHIDGRFVSIRPPLERSRAAKANRMDRSAP